MYLRLSLIPALLFLIPACSTPTISEYQYKPQYKQVQRVDYSNYYELSPLYLEGEKNKGLELLVITQLVRQGIPGEYSLRKLSGYFDTRHYIADARAMLYLYNGSEINQQFELKGLSMEHQKLPLSGQVFHLAPKQSISWALGQVPIDIRLHRILTRIEYVLNGQHMEQNYQQQRLTQQQARQEFRGIQIPNSL